MITILHRGGGRAKWLQYYIGGGQAKWLRDYIGGGVFRDPQKWLRNLWMTPNMIKHHNPIQSNCTFGTNLSELSLAGEDANSMLTDKADRAFQGNVAM